MPQPCNSACVIEFLVIGVVKPGDPEAAAQAPANSTADRVSGSEWRLGELYERRSEPNNAVYYYSRFVELWKDADPELQPQVYDMMRRIERLMGETPS